MGLEGPGTRPGQLSMTWRIADQPGTAPKHDQDAMAHEQPPARTDFCHCPEDLKVSLHLPQ